MASLPSADDIHLRRRCCTRQSTSAAKVRVKSALQNRIIRRPVPLVAKWAADLNRGFDRTCLPLGIGQKMIEHIGDAREAINATQFGVDTFVTKPVAHRRARFDRMEFDTLGSEFASHAG